MKNFKVVLISIILFAVAFIITICAGNAKAEQCEDNGDMDGDGIADTDDWDATDYGDTNEHGRGDGVPDCDEDTDS
jgi:hypothetical protein